MTEQNGTHFSPHDLDAEKCLLGSLLVTFGKAFDEVADVKPEQFFSERHQTIFRAMREMHAEQIPIDVKLLAEQLQRSGQYDEIGGAMTLIELSETVPHAAHVRYYADIVVNKWQSRQIIYVCTQGIRSAADGADEPESIIGQVDQKLLAILEQQAGNVTTIGDALCQVHEQLASPVPPGLPTGFGQLDDLLDGGLRPGALCVIGARPSIGKTALAGTLTLNIARRDGSVLFVSLEQSKRELGTRLLSSVSRIDAQKILSHQLDDGEREQLLETFSRLSEWPIRIDDTPAADVLQISARARIEKRRRGLDLLIVDYLQLITPAAKAYNREQEVTAISRGLKQLAKDLEIPVVCLSQLNRSVEDAKEQRPQLRHLRESGAIEQDADVVMLIHRPNGNKAQDPTETKLLIAKNRNGRCGEIPLHWDAATVTFRDSAFSWEQNQ